MHDGQVEDRVRVALRAEGDALALTITPDELERRLSLRRRERNGRRIGFLAAAVAVVAVGSMAATSSGWFGSTSVGGGPADVASATPTVAPSDGGLPCTAVDPTASNRPPGVIMGATPGDAMAYGGAVTGYIWNGSAVDLYVNGSELQAVAAGPPTEQLEVLASELDTCLSAVTATATSGATSVNLQVTNGGPSRVVAFAKPPAGEWQVVVHVEFSTTDGSAASAETIFRVDTRDRGGAGTPIPESLGQLPQVDGIVLVQDASRSVTPGEPTGITETYVLDPVPPRAQYRVDIACLGFQPIRWSIGQEGALNALVAADQPCDGTPTSREITLGTPTTDLPVTVQADPATAWYIQISTITDAPAFIAPALRMIETRNTEGAAGAAQAFARCVSVGDASDQCAGEWFLLEGPRQILIPVDARLTFALQDGWRIDQARITAAAEADVRAGTFAPEYSVGFVESGGSQITVPVDLGRGNWIIRVALNASRGDERFGAYYDLPLAIGE